ncbi:MAG: hypothetical protein AAF555_02615 [Verrucomicrobiota bacterium]
MGDENAGYFTGEWNRKLDEKCRLTIPPVFRENISTFFLVQLSGTKALLMMTRTGLDAFWEKYSGRLDLDNAQETLLRRIIYGDAIQCSLDGSGRMVLPMELCQARGLKEEVILKGMRDWIEIWRPADFEASQEKTAQSKEELERKLRYE